MDYERPWGGSHPGCFIVMLDRSYSMLDPFGGSQAGAGQRKADMVATVLDRVLQELLDASRKTGADGNPVTSDRADVAVIGYSGHKATINVGPVLQGVLAGKELVTLTELVP